MYKQYYDVRTNPFELTPDPEYLFLSDDHREAVAGLMYAVLAHKGFSALIGGPGTGKTTILRTLMRWIPESRAIFSVVVNPTLNSAEFLRTCVSGFGIDVGESPKDVVLAKLHRFLKELHSSNRVAVLIVDEAHLLRTELLEEVRLLTNFETEKDKLIHVIIAGQDELADLLARHELRQLKQRISTWVTIEPLSADEVCAYISYRWSRCSKVPEPFDAAAMILIAHFSQGYPRLINSICESALLLGFAQEKPVIDPPIVAAVAADLHLVNDSMLQDVSVVPIASGPEHYRNSPAPGHLEPAQQQDAVPALEEKGQRSSWRARLGLE